MTFIASFFFLRVVYLVVQTFCGSGILWAVVLQINMFFIERAFCAS